MEIIPAILPANVRDLEEKLDDLPQDIGSIQIDLLEHDIWSEGVQKFDTEVHIMAESPEHLARVWAERGAQRIVVHKLTPNILGLRNRAKVGLGVEMHVPLEQVLPLVSSVDFIQLMSIDEIGAQGRPLNPKIFDRIREVREKYPETEISVDGGINIENFETLRELGVNRIIVGSGFKKLWLSQTKK